MTETIDDTSAGIIALTSCPEVSAAITLVSQDELTVTVDVQMSSGAGESWKPYFPFISWGDGTQTQAPTNGHYTHTYTTYKTYLIGVYGANTCGNSKNAVISVTPTAPVPTAAGQIVELDAPTTAQCGTLIDITAKTKNIGDRSGVFKMQLLFDSIVKSTSPQFTLTAGATSSDKIPAVTTPTGQTSMMYEVRCIRVS